MIKLRLTNNYHPTVSVIIPYYNGSQFIERALQSVYAQTVLPFEIIVVNDGSRPDETQFLSQMQKQYSFIVIDQSNGGQGSARNTGVKAAQGDFISFLDQDDFYLPNHLEDLLDALPKKDLQFGFVYGDVCIGNEDGKIFKRGITYLHPPHPKRSVIECIEKDMFILPSATLISKEAFLKVGGFDPYLRGYEDDDLFLRMFLEGLSSYFIPHLVTTWCLNSNSTSFSIHMIRSRFHFFKKLLKLFPDQPNQSNYYFTDYIIPRFGHLFISESMNASLRECKYRSEINHMLKEFSKLVSQNPYVIKSKKLNIYIVTVLLTFFSSKWINLGFKILKSSFISWIMHTVLRRTKTDTPLSSALFRREAMAKGTCKPT